jgi:hypothetical protein
LNGRAPVSSSLMMERRGEGGVGEPTQLCKDLITAQVGVPAARLQKFTLSHPLNGSLG